MKQEIAEIIAMIEKQISSTTDLREKVHYENLIFSLNNMADEDEIQKIIDETTEEVEDNKDNEIEELKYNFLHFLYEVDKEISDTIDKLEALRGEIKYNEKYY